jgi:hypothetical protein
MQPSDQELPSNHELSYLSHFTGANELERLISVDEFSVIDDPLLRRTPYIVNTQYNALLCIDCKHAVSPKSAASHIRKEHSYCNIPRDFGTRLLSSYPSLAATSIHPGHTCNPVFGLAIPLEKFVVCSRCQRGYADVASWRKHICKGDQSDPIGPHPHFLSHVQTFFLGNKLCYFPILTPGPSTTISNDFTLFQSQFSDVDVAIDGVVECTSYRQMHQFLEREGWVLHLAGCTISKLVALVSLPSSKDPLGFIAPNLRTLLSNVQAIVASSIFHVRRLLGRRPS